MTDAQIRAAHAALAEREENLIRMINAWGLDEESEKTLVWPPISLGAQAPYLLPEIETLAAGSPGEADQV